MCDLPVRRKMFDFGVLVAVLIIGTVLIIQSRKNNKKILGVYSQPGKWYYLKYYAFLCLIILRRLKYYCLGKSVLFNVKQMEKLQPLSSHPQAFDAVFFHAASRDGIYICAGTERRHEAKVSGLVYILVPEYGLLSSKKLPKTTLEADPSSVLDMKYYGAEGITFTPVEPMKKWKVEYKGKMKRETSPEEFVDVEMEAEWKSNYPWFLFELDMPGTNLARAFARETWTRKFFQNMKDAHQSHYEQMGYLSGYLKVDGKTYQLKYINAFRDHSYGFKRDWSLMHRYIYHMFYLDDRTKISVGLISQPCTSSSLELGYVNHPDGRQDPIESIDLQLYQHGESGVLPKELCFVFVANGISYEAKIKYEHEAVHFKGNDVQARMHERFGTVKVNGVKGRFISEWHYNNLK